ncbi:MAG: hypothetical protein WCW66_05415 [Patescibacteria group bacterium]
MSRTKSRVAIILLVVANLALVALCLPVLGVHYGPVEYSEPFELEGVVKSCSVLLLDVETEQGALVIPRLGIKEFAAGTNVTIRLRECVKLKTKDGITVRKLDSFQCLGVRAK